MNQNEAFSIMNPDEFFRVLPYFYNPDECSGIRRAWDCADEIYNGQYLKSGEAYVYLVRRIACILILYHAGTAEVMAGLLHDAFFEDTEEKAAVIQERFGKEVMYSVLMNIRSIHRIEREEAAPEEKVSLLKAADRKAVMVFLSERYVHLAAQQPYLSDDLWSGQEDRILELYIPLAKSFELGNLAEDFKLLLTGELNERVSEWEPADEDSDTCQKEEDASDGMTALENDYDKALRKYQMTDGQDEEAVRRLLSVLNQLAWYLRKTGRELVAVLKYQEMEEIIRKRYAETDISRFCFDSGLVALRLGKCYLSMGMRKEALDEFLSAKIYACNYDFYAGERCLELMDTVLYTLAVYYSMNNDTLAEAEATMVAVRNIRKEISDMAPSKASLAKLLAVYTPILDIVAWRHGNPSCYEVEKAEIVNRMHEFQ